jgi:multiple sugar transport system permease protein
MSATPPRSIGSRIVRPVAYVLLAAGALVVLIPFFWMLATSLKSYDEIQKGAGSLLPAGRWRFENYRDAWLSTDPTFWRFLANTVFVVVLTVPAQTLSAAVVAYGLARRRFPGRGLVFGTVLATMMLPGIVLIIPTFFLWRWAGLVNTFDPLVLGAWCGGGGFFIFLLRQFFLSIPSEIEEAALIDGCSPMQMFWLIVIPMSKPALLTVVLISFLAQWNDFLGPLLFLNDPEKYTLAVGVQFFQGAQMGDAPKWHWLMAITVLMSLPVLALFFLAQRKFVEGFNVGGLKG